MVRIVNSCLEKDPDRRPDAAELREALEGLRRELSGERHGFGERFRKSTKGPVFWLVAVVTIALVALTLVVWTVHAGKVRRAREVVLPELHEMSSEMRTNVLPAVKLIREVEPLLGDDTEFQELKSLFTARISIRTEPPGAEISYRAYSEPDAPWESLGTSPIESAVLPATYLRWKVERAGYETVLDVRHTHGWGSESGGVGPTDKLWRIDEVGTRPPDMIQVPGSDEIPPFLADRYEVTNRQYRRFVNAGGYDNPGYWQHEFVRGDHTLDRGSAWRCSWIPPGVQVPARGRPATTRTVRTTTR